MSEKPTYTYSVVPELKEPQDFFKWFNSLPEPTIWEKLVYRLKKLPVDTLWWFKWRFVPKHRYHIAKTKPFLTPGYCDPCIRIQVVLFEETYQWVQYHRKYVWTGTEETEEEIFERTQDNKSWAEDEIKFRASQKLADQNLIEVADWWEPRRKLKDFYLDSDYAGDYLDNLMKADKQIEEMLEKVFRNLNHLSY